MTPAMTLAHALTARDNDHTGLTAAFTARTGLGWHQPTPASATAGTAVSVVIPTRDNAYSLRGVLDALARQDTSGTVQVIVIDDASSDSTATIARLHPAVDTACRLPDPVGAAAARTLGAYLADTDTVVFLDADMVLTPHALANIGARAHPALLLAGFRHRVPYRTGPHLRAETPTGEPDLTADERVHWSHLRPLDDTRDFIDLGHAARYFNLDLPAMVDPALIAAPRAAIAYIGGFDLGWTASGTGLEGAHLGATLIAAGCKVAPLRQLRAWCIDPPDAGRQRQLTASDTPARVAYYRHLLDQPAPATNREADFTSRAKHLLDRAQVLR